MSALTPDIIQGLAKASLTFSNASTAESPSVTNSGNKGEVTVYPPSACGEDKWYFVFHQESSVDMYRSRRNAS